MFGQLTRRRTMGGVGAALCALVVVLSAAGPALAAAPATTDADRGQSLAAVDTEPVRLTVAQSSENANFSVTRTAHDEFTVGLNASYADSLSNDTVQLIISDSDGDPATTRTLDIGDSSPSNGRYTEVHDTPGSDEIRDNVSLADATVSINGTDVSDTAPLQSVYLRGTPVWTNDSQIYVALSGTTGVSTDDAVTVRLGGDSVSPGLQPDRNLLVIDTSEVGGVTGAPTLTVTDGGAPIAAPRSVEPDIRLATDEVELWHPAVAPGTDYTVVVHSIDGRSVGESREPEATATGTVALPNASAVAGASNVTVSLDGTDPLLDRYEVTVDDSGDTEAAVTGNRTVRFNYSLAPLGIDAATVTGDNGSSYLPASDLTVDGNELTLSGTTVSTTDTLRLQTDAGVLTVALAESDGDASGNGTNESSQGGSGLLGGVLSSLFPVGLLVPLLAGAVGAGLYAGREFGEPDYIQFGFGVVVIACIILLVYILGDIVSMPLLTNRLVIGGALGMLVLGAGSYAAGGRILGDETPSHGRHSGGAVTHTVSVTVSDGSGPISGRSKISARKQGTDERVTETVREGRGKLQLSSGNWLLEATHGDYSSSTESIRLGQLHSPDRLTLSIDLPEVSLTVRDPDRDAPIPNASVRLDGDGQTLTKTTDSAGSVSFDPPSGATTVTVTTVHERYHESVSEFTVGSAVTETIDLDSKTGELDLVTRIDGARAGGMDITISPADDYLDDLYGSDVTVTSNPDGTYRSTVMVGRYRAEIDPPTSVQGLYRGSEVTFEVTEDDRTEAVMDAVFTWELSPAHRDRISKIRRDMDQITGKSGIDLAIPNYYAGVIETVLDAVEAFPERGDQFVSVEAHPDDITDATLDAAETAVETVADAMSTKRNRDLFTACADMADTTVRWQGSFDFPALVERLDQDQMAVRRSYAARADSVSERIDSERGVVSEVAPARSMLDEVGIESRGDHVKAVVETHVAIMLLDAVDELFDHPELTERLSRTVF